jgi:hypothetical protein
MDVLNAVITLAIIVVLALGAKVAWMSGFVAGTMCEVKSWLDAFDRLRVPNWQSLPITWDDKSLTLTPEQSKYANQIFVSAYALALEQIRTEIAEARREAMEKAKAKGERA